MACGPRRRATRRSPLAVLIHGSMDRSAGMLKLSRRLDDTYHVLRYDRRGYGRSRPHPGSVRDGPARCRSGNAPRWTAGGVDRAQLRRQRRPCSCGSLARDGTGRRRVRDADVVARLVAVDDGRRIGADDPRPRRRRGAVHAPAHRRSALGAASAAHSHGPSRRRARDDRRAHRSPAPARRGPRSRSPRRCWSSAASAAPNTIARGQTSWRRRSADAELVEIEDAAHFGPNTQPDAVADVIKEFVTRRAES